MAVARASGAASPPTEDVVTVHGGKGTFPMADIHNDDAARPALPDRQEHGVPAREHVPRQRRRTARSCVAINPMWAERFGAAFPDVDDLPAYLQRERVAADRPLARAATQKILRDKGRVDADGRVHLVERPDQIVPIVCGGLGSLHAIGAPELRREPDAEQARRAAPA